MPSLQQVNILLTLFDATTIRVTFLNLVPGHNYTVFYRPSTTTSAPERKWASLNPATTNSLSANIDGLLEDTTYVFNIRDDSVTPPYLFYGESGKPSSPTIQTGTSSPTPLRPNYWYNWNYILSGRNLYVSAATWNSFANYIDDLYEYTGTRQNYVIPYVRPGDIITAYVVEQACRAVNGLAPGWFRSFPVTGVTKIAASWFQDLLDGANSVR